MRTEARIGAAAAAFLIALAGAGHAHAQEAIAGQAMVVDGDTLEIAGTRIRLHGIDAPESRQVCTDGSGALYRCGQRAALALSDHIGRSVVTCTPQTIDKYGRTVARCSVRGEDLERWLVSQGLALAYRKYSPDYIADEEEAHTARRGIWAGAFENPSDFRHRPKSRF